LTALLLFIGSGASFAQVALDVPALMAALGKVKNAKAEFTELRYMAMLTEPVKSSGTLRYVAPDTLERNIVRPKPLKMLVEGRQVTVEEAPGRSRTLALDDSPQLAALIESIRGALAGDQAALERYYSLSVQGTLADWQLLMIPKTSAVQAVVDSIRMAGHESAVHTVETIEHGGDRTVMTIARADP
jgi:hypothetical protein